MSGKIAAAPPALAAESRRLKNAAAEVQSISTALRAPLPPMPGDVRGHVEGELGWALVALSQISGALLDEAGNASRRGNLFELAGEGGFTAVLGGYLGTLERFTDPWIDGLERVLIAPRYARFGTWVRAYTYVNKYGTVVNVDKHWRDLPNKLMDEKPVFVVTAGATTGGALAGAEAGGELGATAGSFVGPEGTVIGGVGGALVGGVVGSKAGHAVGHAISSIF